MASQYITTLVSTVVSFYVPIEDIGTKIAVSMAISQIIIIFGQKIYEGSFSNLNIFKYFFSNNYVVIKHNNPFYDKFIELLYQKYSDKMVGCQLYTEFGKYRFMIDELCGKQLVDIYNYNNKKYDIQISLVDNGKMTESSKKSKEIDFKNIILSSKGSMKMLEEYIHVLIKKCNESSINNLIIYKPHVTTDKKRSIKWNRFVVKTNKTLKNTIVSDDVGKNFFMDITKFINNEQYYMDKGFSYKRGYILYGEPGTGKTSIIKTIANEHNLPIFNIDLSMFETNNELTGLINDINGLVVDKQKYLLIFEDVDRSKVFMQNKRGYYYGPNKITEDCILNILDGLDESYGRIVIMTANDLETVKSVPALVRPGRIDAIVHVTICTQKQIFQIMELYYEKKFEDCLKTDIKITPAKLIQILFLINGSDTVIELLNKVVDFTKFDIEEYISMKNKGDSNDAILCVKNKDSEDNDDNNDDDDVGELRLSIKLDKMKKQLDKQGKDLQNMIELNDEMCEAQKLTLEKKKINFRLSEIAYDKKKKESENIIALFNEERKSRQEKIKKSRRRI